jgi:phosphoribosylaminoimidazole carboxylase
MMMAEACLYHFPNVSMILLDDSGSDSPTAAVSGSNVMKGSYQDAVAIQNLASKCDLLTIEIEHVNVDALSACNNRVFPSPETIRIIQDKFVQKMCLIKAGIAVSPPIAVRTMSDILDNEFPIVLKSRKFAYDGKGNFVIAEHKDVQAAIAKLCPQQNSESIKSINTLYVEKFVNFVCEVSVIVARDVSGNILSYPAVLTVQKEGICHSTTYPLEFGGSNAQQNAINLAEKAVSAFNGSAGIYAVEMFLMNDNSLIVNEIAPRPHNSGHYTIEGCETSQFEQHIRAISGMELGSVELRCGKYGAIIMLNILGSNSESSDDLFSRMKQLCRSNDKDEPVRIYLHWYFKRDNRRGRKMGHITIVSPSSSPSRNNDALARAKLCEAMMIKKVEKF